MIGNFVALPRGGAVGAYRSPSVSGEDILLGTRTAAGAWVKQDGACQAIIRSVADVDDDDALVLYAIPRTINDIDSSSSFLIGLNTFRNSSLDTFITQWGEAVLTFKAVGDTLASGAFVRHSFTPLIRMHYVFRWLKADATEKTAFFVGIFP